MDSHQQFEWDPKKARSNERKHGISFDAAAECLLHPRAGLFHVEYFDEEHSESENRYWTITLHPSKTGFIATIYWTELEDGTTRIISARFATKKETKSYENELKERQSRS